MAGKRKGKKTIYDDVSLALHFKELIEKVKKKQNLEIGDFTEFYIVDLLSRFLLSKNLFIGDKDSKNDDALAIQLYKALEEKSLKEKIAILKNMGDFALYISGFFADYLDRKIVDIDYYIMMGEGAYGAAGELSDRRPRENPVTEIFRELSKKFKKIVDLLAEVSELSSMASDSDVIKIYERWLKTKSPRLKKRLLEKGIIPVFKKLKDSTN